MMIYTVPVWALGYLINGDESDLSPEELETINNFLIKEKLASGHWSLDPDQEPYFSWSNDLKKVGGSVIDLIWVEK